MSDFTDDARSRRARKDFATTQWSLVLAAAESSSAEARDALAELCRAYWQPVYVYLRRRGVDHEKARDLTQGFFAKLIEKNYVGDARRERGRFRTFLLTSVQHYVANEWDREQAAKRGGGQVLLPIDGPEAEKTYTLEPSHEDTPEKLFDRRWARTLLDTSFDRLRKEASRTGGSERFERLLPFISGDSDRSYRDAATELGISESATRVAAHRLRRQFREILRDEVARTVGDPALVDDELRHLFAVFEAGNESPRKLQ